MNQFKIGVGVNPILVGLEGWVCRRTWAKWATSTNPRTFWHDAVAPQGQFLAGGEDQGHPGVRHGHDSGEPEGHGQLRGPPDGRPSASRELTAHQGQGQEWEVRPRQLEPYDGRETLSGNRRGPYGPGDAPAGGGVNPFWNPEVQRRAAQAQPVSAGRATTDDRGRQQGQEEDLEALRLITSPY